MKRFCTKSNTKPRETLEFKMTKSGETFHFNPLVEIEEDMMIGLTGFELYISIFNITEQNKKFELYILPDEKIGGVSY